MMTETNNRRLQGRFMEGLPCRALYPRG